MINYQNIVFDLGNVLVRLDSVACQQAFANLGLTPYLEGDHKAEGQQLMHQLSLGLISTQKFCDDLRTLTKLPLTDEAIANAANKMLADIPDEKKAMLLRLRAEGKRVFLLSNTIDMHWNYCVKALFPYQGHTVDDYFEAVFLSQRLHLEKPDPAIYQEVVRQTGIAADDTLFIDDLAPNCEGAQASVGWHVYQNQHFNDWLSLFSKEAPAL